MIDPVNSPEHYTSGRIETIYAIENVLGKEGFRAYCMGNWMKYSARYKHKGGEEDLKKAEVYLDWAKNGLPIPVEGKLPQRGFAGYDPRETKYAPGTYLLDKANRVWQVVKVHHTNKRVTLSGRNGITEQYSGSYDDIDRLFTVK